MREGKSSLTYKILDEASYKANQLKTIKSEAIAGEQEVAELQRHETEYPEIKMADAATSASRTQKPVTQKPGPRKRLKPGKRRPKRDPSFAARNEIATKRASHT
jgi:hypothetical protein